MASGLKLGLANYILQYNLSWHGTIIDRQGDIAANHEKGSRDKNSEIEGAETFEVGQQHNVRKEEITPVERSGWFSDDQAREIPPDPFISG
jgi:hypothetical protein